jgi:flagellar biosynthesis protein FlhB
VLGGSAATTMREETYRLFSIGGQVSEVPIDLLARSSGRMAMAFLVPILGAAVLAALVSGFAQVGFKPTPKAAKPKLSHLSLKKGIAKFKPATASWELVRTVLKLGLLAVLVWGPMQRWATELGAIRGLGSGLDQVLEESWALLLRVVVLAAVIAIADYLYQRWKVGKDLKMSKDEVKQEHKSSDGDPMVKGQRRRRAMEMSRNRMLGNVAGADVVVTNPTHIAVALRYSAADGAPVVIAKGADHLAAKIRKEAYRHGVPVTRDVPLARALYRRCKVGQHVPAALYEAVAVILALAYRRRGLVPAHAAAPATAGALT